MERKKFKILSIISVKVLFLRGEIKNKSGYFIKLINMDNIQLEQDGKVDKQPREITQEEKEKDCGKISFKSYQLNLILETNAAYCWRSGNSDNERHYQEIIDKTDLLTEHLKLKNVIIA